MSDYTPSIKMSVQKPENTNYGVISFHGDLDKAGLAEVKESLNVEIENLKRHVVVLDFLEMNFINSEGIGFLLTLYYRLLKKDLKMIIVNCSEHVKDVLSVIGMTKIIDCYDSLDDFISKNV
jgi:anti-anti-sigma factor